METKKLEVKDVAVYLPITNIRKEDYRMKRNILAIRLDDRTKMILKEISENRKVSISVVVRALLNRGIDQAIDSEGNIISNGKEDSKE